MWSYFFCHYYQVNFDFRWLRFFISDERNLPTSWMRPEWVVLNVSSDSLGLKQFTCNTCYVGLSSWFGTWNELILEMPKEPSIFGLAALVSINVWLPTIKWPCAAFWLGAKSAKYQIKSNMDRIGKKPLFGSEFKMAATATANYNNDDDNSDDDDNGDGDHGQNGDDNRFWYLCLMAHQPSRDILCQSYTCKRQ